MLQCLHSGESITWNNYNIYTVANVAKKVLIGIPAGLFGPEGEQKLLTAQSRTTRKSSGLLVNENHDQRFPSDGTTSVTINTARLSASLCSAFLTWRNPTEANGDSDAATQLVCSCTKNVPKACHLLHKQLPTSHDYSTDASMMYKFEEHKNLLQLKAFRGVLHNLPVSHRQLAVLVLGILHQMIVHATFSSLPSHRQSPSVIGSPQVPVSSVSSSTEVPIPIEGRQESEVDIGLSSIPLLTIAEGVVKSVVGSLFHSCTTTVINVETAAQVLRELVLQFPVMGEDIIRFYDSLTLGTVWTEGRPKGIQQHPKQHKLTRPDWSAGVMSNYSLTCPLCPGLLDHLHRPVAEKNKVKGIVKAASRLFCIRLSVTPTVLHQQNSEFTGQTTHQLSVKPSHARVVHDPKTPMYASKWVQSRNVVLDRSLPVETADDRSLYGGRPVSKLPSDSKCSSLYHVCMSDDPAPAGARVDADSDDEDECRTEKADFYDAGSKQVTTNHTIVRIRRHQSRYRSFHRRHLENLKRRSEWFLGPTVSPCVTLKNNVPVPSCVFQPPNTSTLSLLSLYAKPLTSRDMAEFGTSIGLLQSPPRLLFTASTGELGTPKRKVCYGTPSPGCDSHLLKVNRHHSRPSVSSVASIQSAPSGDLHSHSREMIAPYSDGTSREDRQSSVGDDNV